MCSLPPRHTEQVRRGAGILGIIMDRETVKCMCRVAATLAKCKEFLGEHVRPTNPEVYENARNLLNDCQQILAEHCDCAPIRLITGQVDEVMANL